MISTKEIKVLDRNSEYFGVKSEKLMENAGKETAKFVSKKFNSKKNRIIIFCGIGNNGGDGFVAARYLAQKYSVTIFLVGREKDIKTDISKKNFKKLKKINLKIFDIDSRYRIDKLILDNNIIIDSMLGVGLSGSLKEPYKSVVRSINQNKDKQVISIDVPTGIGTNISIKPKITLTFHDVKNGMDLHNSGIINIIDIGIPRKAIEFVGPGELSVYYPKSKKESHKGDNGRVLIIGGGPYNGAPALSGLAALRTGSDLVYIATPRNSYKIISCFSPNFIVRSLDSEFLDSKNVSLIKDLLPLCNSVVIGPGLGKLRETQNAIIKIIKLIIEKEKPFVIDADAIEPVGENLDIIESSKAVITPHVGEFRKLTGRNLPTDIKIRSEIVKEWAEKLNVSIFLKSFVDIICDAKRLKLNDIHNEAMTVGGTGDVLAGIIGAFLSKQVDSFNAMRMAAFINGKAGNECFNRKSYGLLATDIIDEIPAVLNKYL